MGLYQLFSDILDYPNLQLSKRVKECLHILSSRKDRAATLLEEFQTFLEETSLNRVQEIFTITFGLQSECCPNVGYHLFGEGSHRAMFMAGLRECYRMVDLPLTNELPDHLSVMLRFLERSPDPEEKEELIYLCLVPALRKMLEGFDGEGDPYRKVLEALLIVFRQNTETKGEKITPTLELQGIYYGK
jgi:nitrate reductase delta subunit